MERSEIVVLVQIARQVVFEQNAALNRVITVFGSNLVEGLFEFVRLIALFVEQTHLHAVLAFEPYCRNRDCAKRLAEVVYFSSKPIAAFAIAPEFAEAGESGICLDVHCNAGFLSKDRRRLPRGRNF